MTASSLDSKNIFAMKVVNTSASVALLFAALTVGTLAENTPLRQRKMDDKEKKTLLDTKERNLERDYFSLKHSYTSNGDYCLDVPKGSTKDFTRLQMYTCNGTAGQKFRFDSNGRLHSLLDDRICVEMNTRFGVFMHSACVDEWLIDNSSPYGPYIKNTGDDKCIAVEWTNLFDMENGDPVICDECGLYNSNAGFVLVY